MALPSASAPQIAVSITIGPPPIPVYVQPICPGEGYIWVPGYWAYGPYGYFWVPGTWVLAPVVGYLWTPGYWAWSDGVFVWYDGYWGPVVGFYGGINYGFGYFGTGYGGGYWSGNRFYYNTTVNNVNTTIVQNTYSKTVINNTTVTNVSYNGGPGGTIARPTAAEQAAARQPYTPPTTPQTEHERTASSSHAQLASVNHGKPKIAATAEPGQFSGKGVVSAKSAGQGVRNSASATTNNAAQPRQPNQPANPAMTPNPRSGDDRPPSARASNPEGNARPELEQKHQRELEKLQQKQDQERQRTLERHEREQQKLAQRGADERRQQEVQQRQQQQLQQLQQKHEQQQQRLQQRQQQEQRAHQQEEQKRQQSQKPEPREDRPPDR